MPETPLDRVELDKPRTPNPWTRRGFTLVVIAGSGLLGFEHGADGSAAVVGVAVAGMCMAQFLHAVGHGLDIRGAANFVEKLGSAIKEARHG